MVWAQNQTCESVKQNRRHKSNPRNFKPLIFDKGAKLYTIKRIQKVKSSKIKDLILKMGNWKEQTHHRSTDNQYIYEKFSALLTTREMQVKTSLRLSHSGRMAKMKESNNNKYGQS